VRTVGPLVYQEEYLAQYDERGSKEPLGLYANHHSHIFLTASGAKYTAGERSGIGGVFTQALLTTMRHLSLHKVRYSELLEYVEASEALHRSVLIMHIQLVTERIRTYSGSIRSASATTGTV
jgi:hypothetical protein